MRFTTAQIIVFFITAPFLSVLALAACVDLYEHAALSVFVLVAQLIIGLWGVHKRERESDETIFFTVESLPKVTKY